MRKNDLKPIRTSEEKEFTKGKMHGGSRRCKIKPTISCFVYYHIMATIGKIKSLMGKVTWAAIDEDGIHFKASF
jgi:hypothetical protein